MQAHKNRFLLSWIGYFFFLACLSETNALKKRVCVIGAGAAGIASLKQLANHLDEFEPIAFEKNSDVGGLWIYTDNTGVDEFELPVHSRMYSNLRTNVPTDLMVFPDYKNYTDGNRSCARHEVVLQYLQNFTRGFDLYQYIRFNTLVEKVSFVSGKDGNNSHWIVLTRHAKNKKSQQLACDAVIVSSGRYYKPYVPEITGIESFPGRIFHSNSYRKPEGFEGQVVVILGAQTSGTDIAGKISGYAKTVYLSHRKAKLLGESPSNVIQVAGVVSANGSELTLQDGSKITVDVFIYCTGYLKDYSFLDESSGISLTNDDNDVEPLYKYIVNIEHESMGFVGVYRGFFTFAQYYLQAQYYVAVLQGKLKLPNRPEMLKDMEENRLKPGQSRFNFESILYQEYINSGYVQPLPDFYEPAKRLWLRHMFNEQFYLRDYNLRIHDNGNLEIYKAENRSDVLNQDVNK